MQRYLVAIILLLSTCYYRCSSPSKPVLTQISYNYYVILPEKYDTTQIWPVIVFLHGQSSATFDLDIFNSYGLGNYADSTENFPFIIVAPQTFGVWYPDMTEKVIQDVIANYPIDTNRIYGTGFSMGGYGIYVWAMEYPLRFAAIAPVAAWGVPEKARLIKDIPIWIFHNAGDPVIDSAYARIMADSLRACGSVDLRMTLYDQDTTQDTTHIATHNAWIEAYHTPELYQWFLDHKRGH